MIGRPHWATVLVVATVGGIGGLATAARAPGPEAVVYKSASCGCCKKWAEHVQAAGFRVTEHDTTNLARRAARSGVPHKLSASPTPVLASYVFEGHVPA